MNLWVIFLQSKFIYYKLDGKYLLLTSQSYNLIRSLKDILESNYIISTSDIYYSLSIIKPSLYFYIKLLILSYYMNNSNFKLSSIFFYYYEVL
jgi:hypothetical protein